MKMWGGRFEGEINAGFMEFTSSVEFDSRLYPYDIACTKAWSKALLSAGVLGAEEESEIGGALEKIKKEFEEGRFEFEPTDEDVHTAVERRLVELVGTFGGKVRTGRSRNDQVATDMRLFVMDACSDLNGLVRALQKALLDRARETVDVPVPGHTHLQQAQPVLLAHKLLAFLQMLERDSRRLSVARSGADSMPLGSGALAGTGLTVDRDKLASELGFLQISENSVDAVSDRDFVCEMLFTLSMIMVHLSRLSEQVILWCSQEFGLVELDDEWATGSSLMPQKKNPDGPELVRGKTGRVVGSLLAMLTVMKGIPLAYNRDLQEDKEPLFDAIDTTASCLMVMERTVATMKFNRDRARELVSGGLATATDLADCLVEKGVEFPVAHRVVGEVVTYCLKEGKGLEELSVEELKSFSEMLDEEDLGRLSVDASLSRRETHGGTAPGEVSRQIAAAEKAISGGEGAL